MANITDQFVPTSVYSFTNVGSGKRISLPEGADELQSGSTANDLSDKVCFFLLQKIITLTFVT